MSSDVSNQQETSRGLKPWLHRQKRALINLPENARREWRMMSWVARERRLLREARARHEASYRTFDNPLVSIPIATYNRGQILTERTIPCLFEQTYQNFEVIVVGDGCPDDTPQRMAKVTDPRVRFHLLAERGRYPENPFQRWQVAGCVPGNKGLELVRGKWIAYIDDDDLWSPDHLEVMLARAYETNAELVHALSDVEDKPGQWRIYGEPDFPTGRHPYKGRGQPHSAVMYRSYLNIFCYDPKSHEIDRCTDYWMWHRMARAGVRTAHLPQLVASQPLRPNESLPSPRAFGHARPKNLAMQARLQNTK